MRYNLHKVKWSDVVSAWWIFVYLYHPAQERSGPFFQKVPLRPFLKLSIPQSDYHHGLVLLVLELHVSGTVCPLLYLVSFMLYSTSGVISLFFFVVVFCCKDYCFLALLLMDIWIVRNNWLLWLKLLWTFLYVSFGKHKFTCLLGKYPGVELVGSKAGVTCSLRR